MILDTPHEDTPKESRNCVTSPCVTSPLAARASSSLIVQFHLREVCRFPLNVHFLGATVKKPRSTGPDREEAREDLFVLPLEQGPSEIGINVAELPSDEMLLEISTNEFLTSIQVLAASSVPGDGYGSGDEDVMYDVLEYSANLDSSGSDVDNDEKEYSDPESPEKLATAAQLDLLPLPPFHPVSDTTSISQRWQQWKRRFETYLLAVNITDDAQKRASLLYQAGAATQEIFDSLPVEQNEATDYNTALAKLDTYFALQKNVDFEIFQLRQAKQKIGETTDQFATRLCKLDTNCEFTDLDKEIKSAIIQNCSSKQLRRLALREEKLTLAVLLSG
eukprot:gene9946-18559_t